MSTHLAQLFDDTDSLADTVVDFLFEGWRRGEALLVVARAERWVGIARGLADRVGATDELQAGRLVVLDADITLSSLLRNGRPLPDRFATVVGAVVGRLVSEFGRVRIYGDMVDVLAAREDFAATKQLEELWNKLATAYTFTLLCGYTSGHFGDLRSAGALRDICGAHDQTSSKPADLLGSWLLADRRSRAHASS